MLLLEGVEVHVREDAFKNCLRRHMDWLDELVIDADDNTWLRWTSRRQTKDQRTEQDITIDQMSGDGSETPAASQPKTRQKRRFEVQSRTKTVAQNVLKTVRRRRGGAAVPGALPQQRVQSQTLTDSSGNLNTQFQQQRTPLCTRQTSPTEPDPPGGKSPRISLQSEINLIPSVTNVESQQQLNESENVVSSTETPAEQLDLTGPEILSSAEIESTLDSINNAQVESDNPTIPNNSIDYGQHQTTSPRIKQKSPVKLAPPVAELPKILLRSGINLKPSSTYIVSQKQLNKSESVSSPATAPVSSASAESLDFSGFGLTVCEILSCTEIESTLKSIENAAKESDISTVPNDANVDAASTNKNQTNVEQPSESGLSTPPPPAVSSCDNTLEQLESVVNSAPSFEQLEMSSSATGGENIEPKYSEQLNDTNTADINTLPVQQSRHHQGHGEVGDVKNEPMKIDPVEISSGSDDDEDYSTQQIVQQQHDPQPGTSGSFNHSDSNRKEDDVGDAVEDESEDDYVPDEVSASDRENDTDAKSEAIPVVRSRVNRRNNNRRNNTNHNTANMENDEQMKAFKLRLKLQTRNVTIPLYPQLDNGARCYSKLDYCLFCGWSFTSKISAHLRNMHFDEPQVQKALSLPFKERNLAFLKMQNEGNFMHNVKVIEAGEGELVIARRPTHDERTAADYLPCKFCMAFYVRAALCIHVPRCAMKPSNAECSNYLRNGMRMLMPYLKVSEKMQRQDIVVYSREKVKCVHRKKVRHAMLRRKILRRRWTQMENDAFCRILKDKIQNQTMPSFETLNSVAKAIGGSRTIAQIRTKLHNVISGKLKL
ncbi:uncharacterized protein LOC141909522 [Tubulanus polymorphus]|uniref:uncharacterized protein LOC141909522 n=1 Tax=Tubulanus polymorphus TaxID=672921 RepID=UPI003DA3401C